MRILINELSNIFQSLTSSEDLVPYALYVQWRALEFLNVRDQSLGETDADLSDTEDGAGFSYASSHYPLMDSLENERLRHQASYLRLLVRVANLHRDGGAQPCRFLDTLDGAESRKRPHTNISNVSAKADYFPRYLSPIRAILLLFETLKY